ncbi:unnamed protein product, partial [Rotaria sp. Silwood1]
MEYFKSSMWRKTSDRRNKHSTLLTEICVFTTIDKGKRDG